MERSTQQRPLDRVASWCSLITVGGPILAILLSFQENVEYSSFIFYRNLVFPALLIQISLRLAQPPGLTVWKTALLVLLAALQNPIWMVHFGIAWAWWIVNAATAVVSLTAMVEVIEAQEARKPARAGAMGDTLGDNRHEWSVIDMEPCLVIAFEPFGAVVDEKVQELPVPMPYADLTVVFGNRSINRGHAVTWHWPVVHRADFLHLWQAFRVRPLGVDEEVIVVWAASDHTGFIERIFASFLPRINVMVCPKGSYTNFPTWDERVRHGKTPDLTLLNPLAVWFAKQHGRITGEAA